MANGDAVEEANAERRKQTPPGDQLNLELKYIDRVVIPAISDLEYYWRHYRLGKIKPRVLMTYLERLVLALIPTDRLDKKKEVEPLIKSIEEAYQVVDHPTKFVNKVGPLIYNLHWIIADKKLVSRQGTGITFSWD